MEVPVEYIVFIIFMQPLLHLRAEQPLHLWTQLRVWVSKGAELDPGNPRQHSD